VQAEGRIETTDFQEIFCLDDTFGLDTAALRLHRLLDHRDNLEQSVKYLKLLICHKTITDAWLCQNILWAFGVFFQFLAQLAHIDA